MSLFLAYLDATSGGMIVQAIVAGAAGAAVILKLYWRKLTRAFRKGAPSDGGVSTASESARVSANADGK